MKFNEKMLDRLVDKLIGNPNINTKEKIILNRYYNSEESFSRKIRALKSESLKLELDEGYDFLSDEFSIFYETFIKNHPLG